MFTKNTVSLLTLFQSTIVFEVISDRLIASPVRSLYYNYTIVYSSQCADCFVRFVCFLFLYNKILLNVCRLSTSNFPSLTNNPCEHEDRYPDRNTFQRVSQGLSSRFPVSAKSKEIRTSPKKSKEIQRNLSKPWSIVQSLLTINLTYLQIYMIP